MVVLIFSNFLILLSNLLEYQFLDCVLRAELSMLRASQRAVEKSRSTRVVEKYYRKAQKRISRKTLFSLRELVKWMKEEWKSAGIETVSTSKHNFHCRKL